MTAATVKAAKAPRTGRNKGGRPGIPFTGTDSDKVRLLARAGTKHEIIATMMGCCDNTLRAKFREELAEGIEHAKALVGATLFEKAMGGDTASIIWFEKTRCGFRETSRHEHTGKDGAPIATFDLSTLSADERKALLPVIDKLVATAEAGDATASEAG